jgi:predicted double-glycine peptidase
LTTKFDNDGICRQSNDYNCGPAAAVTALRKLGFSAEEGELAIEAHTSSATGTPPDILARTLQLRYGNLGLSSEFRVFHNLAELKAAGLTLAVIKYNFWVDHYVTILEVRDAEILVGDPFHGLRTFTRDEFEKKWRFVGVVLKRNGN